MVIFTSGKTGVVLCYISCLFMGMNCDRLDTVFRKFRRILKGQRVFNDFIILAGNTLTCYKCASLLHEEVEVKCNYSSTVECSGMCFSTSITTTSGAQLHARGCDNVEGCQHADAACILIQARYPSYKSCHISCCDTDYCNTAKDIMAAKAFICFMVIVGFFIG
jgi:hypothetical protein